MEESWAQSIRRIAKKDQSAIVDAKIDDQNHLMLKTREQNIVDAGIVKPKKPGRIVYLPTTFVDYDVVDLVDAHPDIYVSLDGGHWHPAVAPKNYGINIGASNPVDGGCWTGDRFIVPFYQTNTDRSSLLQSRDGGSWELHPDKVTFPPYFRTQDRSSAATGNGLVVVIGSNFNYYIGVTLHTDGKLAVSYDFGETWKVIPDADVPFGSWGSARNICLKNEFEWIVTGNKFDGSRAWYTYDGGAHWSEITFPIAFWGQSVSNSAWIANPQFFNGYWWFFGRGLGTGEWDTPIIRTKDLLNWEPVITPFSGTYSPLEAYLGRPHSNDSGDVTNIKYDPHTNTVVAVGKSKVNNSKVILSTDGGEHWLEIGHVADYVFRTDRGWEGIYNWPNSWTIILLGGIAYAYGWWFISNQTDFTTNAAPLFRMSTDGKITEPVILQTSDYGSIGSVVYAGGDVT
jgi:hypothetical protein